MVQILDISGEHFLFDFLTFIMTTFMDKQGFTVCKVQYIKTDWTNWQCFQIDAVLR